MNPGAPLTPLVRSAVPAGAYDDHLARVLPAARDQRTWVPDDGAMPSLFVSHGAPFTLDDAQWLTGLFAWAQAMPKPRAIIVVSAHWEQAPAAISGAAEGTPLYYDFSGFHPRYKTLTYATPDATGLARRVRGALRATTQVHEFTGRGLDHGAFIPLMAMYPAADIPVVQLSMPSLGPDALADFRRKAPGAAVAHPTDEHFVPLLLTVGAATDAGSAVSTLDRMVMGNSIRSIQMR